MIIDDFYNYIVLMAFEKLYKYENKKSISIDKLKHFRSLLLEEILDIYKNNRGHNYLQEIDKWSGEVTFKKSNEEAAIKEFLEEYANYFYLDNGIIYLKEYVKYNDICELLRQLKVNQNIPNRFDIVDRSKKLMDALGIKTIEKVIEEYSRIEAKIEKLYYELYTNEDSENLRKNLKALLFIRFSFFTRIAQMSDYRVDAFRLVAGNYYEEKDTVRYDKYPIDLNLWEKEFADPDDFLGDIDDRVYDITQYAIFGKKQNFLYLDKIHEDLDSYYMSEHIFSSRTNNEDFDPIKDYTDMIETDMLAAEQFEEDYENHPESFVSLHDSSDEFWVLYINYLNNLNHFMAVYGESEELLFAKKDCYML